MNEVMAVEGVGRRRGLSNRGRHFANALAASDWTSPSVVGMLTGRYPSDSGLLSTEPVSTQSDRSTLGSTLRRAGFSTAAVVSNPTLSGDRLHLEAGFDNFDARMTARERNRPVPIRPARQTTESALRALAQLNARNGSWFLWVQYLEPHGPYLPPPPYPRAARDPGDSIPLAPGDIAERGSLPRYQFLQECRGRNDYAVRYRSSAAYALDEVDRFLSLAAGKGLLNDTVVVFTSDHGEFLGEEDFWFQHGVRLNPAVVHVPLVVARSLDEPLRRDSRPVSHLDVMPTVLGLLGVAVPSDLRGEDLFAPPPRRRHPLLTENIAFPDSAEVGAVVGDRLLVKSTAAGPQAFLLDGNEWAPAAASSVAARAMEEVDAEMTRVRKLPLPQSRTPPDEINRLRALGYLR